jgi:hypothetical protein
MSVDNHSGTKLRDYLAFTLEALYVTGISELQRAAKLLALAAATAQLSLV